MSSLFRTQLFQDLSAELRMALAWKSEGKTSVSAAVAGAELAAGREEVPLDEYIEMWRANSPN